MCALRIGVIGGGYWGSKHAEKVKVLEGNGEGVKLSCIVDIREEVKKLAEKLECDYYPAIDFALDVIDACIVAVPASFHFDVVRRLLEEGKHVFVEKPMTLEKRKGEELLRMAEEKKLVLTVGHIEKLNPAFEKAREMLSFPLYIEGERLSPFSKRGTDVDVVYDLMIHDLEILLSIMGGDAEVIEAVGAKVLTDKIDIAKVFLRFDKGAFADLTASRVSMKKMRKLRFFERDLYLSIDFVEPSLEMVRMENDTLIPYFYSFEERDVLLEEVRGFVNRIRDGWDVEEVKSAVEAIGLAEKIVERIYFNLENVSAG